LVSITSGETSVVIQQNTILLTVNSVIGKDDLIIKRKMATFGIYLSIASGLLMSGIAYAADIEQHLPAVGDTFTIDQPAGTELMRVQGDGDVGINTTSPSSGEQNLKLDVHGAIGADFYCDKEGNNCFTVLGLNNIADGDAWNVTGEDQTSAIVRTGGVGIGTTSPDPNFRFNVHSGGAAAGHVVKVSSDAQNTFLALQNNSDLWYLRSGDDGSFAIHQPAVSDRLTVINNGNVGIGTTVPGAKLTVSGGVSANNYYGGVSDTSTAIGSYSDDSFANGFQAWGATSPNPNILAFITQSTERMRITADGNVGIGGAKNPSFTNAATSSLEVTGSNGIVKISHIAGTNTELVQTGAQFKIDSDPSNAKANSSIQFFVDGTHRMIIHDNGKVGIGTATPSAELQVEGATIINGIAGFTGQTISPVANTWGQRIVASTTPSQSFGIQIDAGTNSSDVPLHIRNAATTKTLMTVLGNGHTGLGTPAPTHILDVAGGGYVRFAGTFPLLRFDASGNSGQNFQIQANGEALHLGSTLNDFNWIEPNLLVLYKNSNVGIGVATPLHPLHMVSGAHVTSGGVWTNASSRNLKENIKQINSVDALKTLQGLQPVTYNYKNSKDENYAGFIAEDVPDMVAMNDRKSLASMDILAVLTRVVQNQQKELEALKAEICAYQ